MSYRVPGANKHLAKDAERAVRRAIRRGDLVRPQSCSRCGRRNERIDGHHPDYAKPLDVVWVCRTCHGIEHGTAPREEAIHAGVTLKAGRRMAGLRLKDVAQRAVSTCHLADVEAGNRTATPRVLELYKLAGISPTHACDIEHGRRRATPEIVAQYEALARKEGRP